MTKQIFGEPLKFYVQFLILGILASPLGFAPSTIALGTSAILALIAFVAGIVVGDAGIKPVLLTTALMSTPILLLYAVATLLSAVMG